MTKKINSEDDFINNFEREDTFIDRLHLLLDRCGIPKKSGRLTRVADLADVSLAGARRWLEENSVPRDKTLKVLLESLTKLLPDNIEPETLKVWLLKGEGSPFDHQDFRKQKDFTSKDVNNMNIIDAGEVYVKVIEFAERKNINLYDENIFSKEKFKMICERMLAYHNLNLKPDPERDDKVISYLIYLTQLGVL